MSELTMIAKFPGKCAKCGCEINENDLVKFNMFSKTFRHVKCNNKEQRK